MTVNDCSERLCQVVGILNAVCSCLNASTNDDPITEVMMNELYYSLQGAISLLQGVDEALVPLAFHPVLTEK